MIIKKNIENSFKTIDKMEIIIFISKKNPHSTVQCLRNGEQLLSIQ